MAARLTDKQKKKIIADYVQLGSYNATAKVNGVSLNTVKKADCYYNGDFDRQVHRIRRRAEGRNRRGQPEPEPERTGRGAGER